MPRGVRTEHETTQIPLRLSRLCLLLFCSQVKLLLKVFESLEVWCPRTPATHQAQDRPPHATRPARPGGIPLGIQPPKDQDPRTVEIPG